MLNSGEVGHAWELALAQYKAKMITKDALKPFWISEVENFLGLKIDLDRAHQADPLFTHGWSPHDAANHLRRVWIMKGWLRN